MARGEGGEGETRSRRRIISARPTGTINQTMSERRKGKGDYNGYTLGNKPNYLAKATAGAP